MGLTSWIAKNSGLVKNLRKQNEQSKARLKKAESKISALKKAAKKLEQTKCKPEHLHVRLAKALELQSPTETTSPVGTTTPVDVSDYLQRANDLLSLIPEWARVGRISGYDGAFLWKLIDECKPSRILEVGSLAGVSTSLLVEASLSIDECHIDALDIATHCYFDRSRAIGEAVPEMTKNAGDRLTWHLGNALGNWPNYDEHRNSFDFIFIDAMHTHPWPTLDILAALPLIKVGGWIALHDTFLSLKSADPISNQAGVALPFLCWNGEKRIGAADLRKGDCSAIRVTESVKEHALAIATTLFCPHEAYANPAYIESMLALVDILPSDNREQGHP